MLTKIDLFCSTELSSSYCSGFRIKMNCREIMNKLYINQYLGYIVELNKKSLIMLTENFYDHGAKMRWNFYPLVNIIITMCKCTPG
ncbi:uncharacterized protein OCT59_022083 [Rhizophagus irregularis]|uniref:uncharacterized protein n=1 Tax=Rhizophagus irregularis TaxID=588596 RepID=UPI003317B584|nr:hypothetical protein OCT59_022083 [Rhizophagus irregularis]